MAIHADLGEGKCSIPSQRNGLSNQPERERETHCSQASDASLQVWNTKKDVSNFCH